jgi:ABC-2 type transport system permease protein
VTDHAAIPEPTAGAVYDRGYRPYDGSRGGRWAPVGALWLASVRRALGLRRSWRQKVAPWSLLAIVSVPAVVNVGVAYLTRETPAEGFEFITYREYVGVSSALLAFVAITAPDVICPDRRNRVLPLIFARPIDASGYVLAKVGAIAALVFAFGFLPQVVLFVGQMLVSSGGALDYLRGNAEVLWQVPVAVAVLALYYSSLGVALASLSARRIVGGVAFVAVLLVSTAVAGALGAARGTRRFGLPEPNPWEALNLLAVPLHVRDLVFLQRVDPLSPLSGVAGAEAMVLGVWAAVIAVSLGVLLWRYREAG